MVQSTLVGEVDRERLVSFPDPAFEEATVAILEVAVAYLHRLLEGFPSLHLDLVFSLVFQEDSEQGDGHAVRLS